MKILFLHGWQSTPGGLKPTYLKDHGHEILNPKLPDDDFDAAVRIAQAEFDQGKPDVVVGSSRGGAVAMNIDSGETPLVLLCPAWKSWGTATTVKQGTTILHSRADETVPFADSEELVRNSGVPSSAWIEVGTEHRLADPESLAAMLIACEFTALPKNWYSIYQWGRTARVGYGEWVASLILSRLDQINLVLTDFRQSGFRVGDHRGQLQLQTDIAQFTEKRFCRAMFNRSQVPLLGRVIDYEVPLKGTQNAPHGDIDLLSADNGKALLIEAKKPGTNESVLKAILEAFAYSSLVATVRSTFLQEFSLPQSSELVPVVLTFPSASSGRQLAGIDRLPRLRRLIVGLNHRLGQQGIAPLRFLIVDNEQAELDACLMTRQDPNGDVKVVFRNGFVPRIRKLDMIWDA